MSEHLLELWRQRIGARVVYTAPHGACEHGTVTSVGTSYVFVRYDGDQHSKATAAHMIELAA